MLASNGVPRKKILKNIASTSIKQSLQETHSQASQGPSLSFQLMTRAEPPAMVIATIQSLLAVKAPQDEIIIIDNRPLAKVIA